MLSFKWSDECWDQCYIWALPCLVEGCRELHTITTLEILNMCISFTECSSQSTQSRQPGPGFLTISRSFTGCFRKKTWSLGKTFFSDCNRLEECYSKVNGITEAVTAATLPGSINFKTEAISTDLYCICTALKFLSGIFRLLQEFFLEYPRISPGYKILSRVTETIPSNFSSYIRPYSHKKCNIYNVMSFLFDHLTEPSCLRTGLVAWGAC